MKKYIILFLLLFLASCFWSNSQEVEEAKKDLLWDSYNNEEYVKNDENIKDNEEDKTVEDNISKSWATDDDKVTLEKSNLSIQYLDENKFITLDDLSWKNLDTLEVEITWETNQKVDKIEVSFSNETSDFPDDISYGLMTFKPGDKTFKYRASYNYKVYDYWENIYLFKAYSWNETSEIKLVINKVNNSTDLNVWYVSYEKQLFWEDWDEIYLSFPKSSLFWDPVLNSKTSLTYSKIKDLNIEKQDNSSITCENLNDFLTDKLNTWYYWNTCRDVIKEKWISFYVIRLDWDNYFYEKHYIDYNHLLYWTLLIETWTWVDSENISDKNEELKEKYEETSNEEIDKTDLLFKDLVR